MPHVTLQYVLCAVLNNQCMLCIRRHVSAAEGAYSVVEWLVMEGADVNAIDRHGRTPLEEAARNDHGEVVRLLIQHGGSVYEENKVGGQHGRAEWLGVTSMSCPAWAKAHGDVRVPRHGDVWVPRGEKTRPQHRDSPSVHFFGSLTWGNTTG